MNVPINKPPTPTWLQVYTSRALADGALRTLQEVLEEIGDQAVQPDVERVGRLVTRLRKILSTEGAQEILAYHDALRDVAVQAQIVSQALVKLSGDSEGKMEIPNPFYTYTFTTRASNLALALTKLTTLTHQFEEDRPKD